MIDTPKTWADILPDVKKALTESQYKRLEDAVTARHNVLELAGMNLDSLKKTLRPIVESDPEKEDIISRLDAVMPGIREVIPVKQNLQEATFLSNPIDYVSNKVWNALGGAKKAVMEAPRNIAIATLWKGAVETVESVQKAKWFIDKLLQDPLWFFKELMDVILSGDFWKIKAFFSGTTQPLGLSSSIIEKFSEKWFPSDIVQWVKKLFSLENFTKLKYSEVEKIWKKYQKNPKIDFSKELRISSWDAKSIWPLLENFFWKNSEKLIDRFVSNGWEKEKIWEISLWELVSKIVG